MSANTVLETARAYVAGGLSVIPIRADGSKAPEWAALPRELRDDDRYHPTWKPFEERLPTGDELGRWFGTGHSGLAVLGGEVSGGLEIIDFDRAGTFEQWWALVAGESWDLLQRLTVVRTPREGGMHVYYRCPGAIEGNLKLAREKTVEGNVVTLIETRGEGGYVLAPGCPTACHSSKGVYAHHAGPELPGVQTIIPDERSLLLEAARSLSLHIEQANAWDRPTEGQERPGDAFNGRAGWEEVLPAGWVKAGGNGTLTYWRRPGKNHGWSATTGPRPGGADLLYVFSSNAAPFESERSYSKFAAYATLNHSGDYRAAARDLAERGYGTPRRQQGANGHTAAPKPAAKANPAVVFPPPLLASELRSVDPERAWLWYGYLSRGSLSLFSSLWKAGKTTLLSHLLRVFEDGGEFCGLRVAPGKVLYVTEESEGRWAQRRDKLGLKDHLSFVVRPFKGKPDWSQWNAFLDYLRGLQRQRAYDLIVFDPLSNLWPVKDENDAPQVQQAIMPLPSLVGEAAGLLSHHHRKGDGNEATAARGSGALMAFVDTIIELRRYDPQAKTDRRRVLTGYGRDEETPQEVVVELTDAGFEAQGDRRGIVCREIVNVLLALLPNAGPGLTTREIEAAWPEDQSPRHQRLTDALHHGLETEQWVREGDGRSGDPYRYWRPLHNGHGRPP